MTEPLYPRTKSGTWTPVIGGGAFPGSYPLSTNGSRYMRIGNRVFLDLYVQLAGSGISAGSGLIQVSGLPYTKITGSYPVGPAQMEILDLPAGAQPVIGFVSSLKSGVLLFRLGYDNASANGLDISTLSANDILLGSISYETDDPF